MNDPSSLYAFMKKYVEIELKSCPDKLIGWVFTIDPVSSSYVLVTFDGDEPDQATMVMGEEVKSVKILPSPVQDANLQQLILEKLETLFSDSDQEQLQPTVELITRRRDQLVDWLQKNRLPLKIESAEGSDFPIINILDTVQIRAPYEEKNCESTNEIILDKVRSLIKNLN
ncbi:gem-associated 6 [Brachionus plicatilis]|uniref:Gem-associated 6 n=1 Tax=Brachionus plicatilis TaxID=10195 RepID=A0A3M7SV23_BRAPC|nr:gem-associated 6 [Brachionus plicatilis]